MLTVYVFLTNSTQSRTSTSTNAWVKSSFYSKVCYSKLAWVNLLMALVKLLFYSKVSVTVDAFTFLKFLGKSTLILRKFTYVLLWTHYFAHIFSCFTRTLFAVLTALNPYMLELCRQSSDVIQAILTHVHSCDGGIKARCDRK